MATPLVAGIIGFLKAQDSTLTAQRVLAILQTTGVKANITTQCNCRVDLLAATTMVVDKKMYLVPAAGTYAPDAKLKFDAQNAQGPIQWVSSDESVMKIDANGEAQAIKDGQVTIAATDAQGAKAQTLTIFVGKSAPSEPPPDDPGTPGEPGSCPFQDPQTCAILCQVMPDMPFCKK
jgi:thermitase